MIREIIEFIEARPGVRGVIVPRRAWLEFVQEQKTLPHRLQLPGVWMSDLDCASMSYNGVPIILDDDAEGITTIPVKLAIFGGTGIGDSLWESE